MLTIPRAALVAALGNYSAIHSLCVNLMLCHLAPFMNALRSWDNHLRWLGSVNKI